MATLCRIAKKNHFVYLITNKDCMQDPKPKHVQKPRSDEIVLRTRVFPKRMLQYICIMRQSSLSNSLSMPLKQQLDVVITRRQNSKPRKLRSNLHSLFRQSSQFSSIVAYQTWTEHYLQDHRMKEIQFHIYMLQLVLKLSLTIFE